MVAVALKVVRWRKHPPERLALGKILGIEFAIFTLMGLLSVIDGASISEAEAGQDLGGLVGWGIAEIFRSAVGADLCLPDPLCPFWDCADRSFGPRAKIGESD